MKISELILKRTIYISFILYFIFQPTFLLLKIVNAINWNWIQVISPSMFLAVIFSLIFIIILFTDKEY